MKKIVSIVFILVVIISSCKKEELFESVKINNTPLQESNVSLPKTTYAVGWYRVNTCYKTAYVHKTQNPGECCWTNYVLATSAIVRGKGVLTYPYNGSYENKIAHCKTWCQNNPTALGASGITTIQNYCNQVDAPANYPINCSLGTTSRTDKLGAVQLMLGHINSHHTPFLYVGSVNNIGHYFTVWSIYWGGTLSSSTIYFTNTLDAPATNFDNQIRSQNLSDFLNLNVMNNNNMLFCINKKRVGKFPPIT